MHIAILGNGISGSTAARFIRKLSTHRITMISAESALPYSRTALMYIYMGHVPFQQTFLYSESFYEKNNIDRICARVDRIDFEQQQLYFDPEFSSSSLAPPEPSLHYDVLILATGSQPNKFGWPGQNLKRVHGLYSLQDLQALDKISPKIDKAVIVGGGLIGVELAEMLHSRNKKVTMLVRESSYWDNVLPPEESAMVNNEIREHGIELQLNTELKEIIGDNSDQCQSVITGDGNEISCQFVGLTAGVHPNVDFLNNSPLDIEKGILVDTQLKTNVPGVYAIGDCAQLKVPDKGRAAIEAVWYTGKMMGEIAAYNICGSEKNYHPGVWFNSAKFFNIEYQVYGQVPPIIEHPLKSFYWQDHETKRSIRIVYHSESQKVVGFNVMGVRFRQELCTQWIEKRQDLKTVMENLPAAFFDPELYPEIKENIKDAFTQETGQNIEYKSQKGLRPFRNQIKKLLKLK